jgi:hypothetical protein
MVLCYFKLIMPLLIPKYNSVQDLFFGNFFVIKKKQSYGV